MKEPKFEKISRRRLLGGFASLGASGATVLKSTETFASAILPEANGMPTGEAIKLSILNIIREGVSDVIEQPAEVELLASSAQFRRSVALKTLDSIGTKNFSSRNFSPLEFLEVPKSSFGMLRTCAVMDPLDTVAYLSLAVQVAPAIERERRPVDENRIFSYRFAPHRARLFDKRFAFPQFVDRVRELRKKSNFIVRCDIERFYPSISSALMRASLERCRAPRQAVDTLSHLLDFWTSSSEGGLPVGSNASRILAESTLIPVDDALDAAGVNFVRFVDDYCLFSESEKAAALALEALNDHLAVHKFCLNRNKTRVSRASSMPSQSNAPEAPAGNFGPDGTFRSKQGAVYRLTRAIGDPPPTISGTASLPKNFRLATKREIRKLARSPRADATPLVNGSERVQPWQLRRSIRIAAYTNDAEYLIHVPEILSRYPEFSKYISSMLVKRAASLSREARRIISNKLSVMLLDKQTPTFVALDLLKLLSTAEYRRRLAIKTYASLQAREARGIKLQSSLRALRLTGGIPSELFRQCENADVLTVRTLLLESGRLSEHESFVALSLSSQRSNEFA